MKKLFLGILAFMVISSLSFVSAGGDINITIYMEGEIVSPSEGSYVRGVVDVEWENSAGDSSLQLQYAEGTCTTPTGDWNKLADSGLTSHESYSWGTTEVNDGKVCLRLQSDATTYDSINLTVDNEDPSVTMSDISFPNPDEKTNPVNVGFFHSDNEAVTFCEIDFGGMTTKNCLNGSQRSYQFKDNGEHTVTITVKDLAGNTATDSVVASVANVAPTIMNQINGPTEVAAGQVVTFNAQADDVDADLNAGLTCNWKFDGSFNKVTTANNTGYCSVEYTWDSASVHTVDICVKDKDNGQNCSFTQYLINVEGPEYMTPMQQVVQRNEFQFDLDEAWAVNNKKRFKTSFTDLVTCTAIVAPNGMNVSQNGPNNRCEVNWIPSNEQRGEHKVIIRVNDSTEHKYYSFDVTVYSWGIELSKGWNLISIPYIPADTSINSVFGNIIENVAYEDTSTYTIFQYYAVNGKWYKARKSSATGSTYSGPSSYKLTTIVPGYAYWIKMENEDWIYGIEDNFGVSFIPGQAGIDLATESWNLIGRFGSNSVDSNYTVALKSLRIPFYMEDYVSDLLGIYKLDSVATNGNAIWSPTTMIYPVQGYWVRTAAGSEGRETIKYEPSTL